MKFKKLTQSTERILHFATASDFRLLIILSITTLWVWHLNFYFYFWDEWGFLNQFTNHSFDLLMPHNEHFKPLFKLVYYLELFFFKNNPLASNYISLLAHGVTCFLIYKVAKNLLYSPRYALLAAALFLINPFHYGTLLWNFQICSILNVIAFLLSILFLQNYFKKDQTRYLLLSFLFCFLQAYFFGTGLILPFILILYFFLFRERKHSRYLGLIYFLIFLLNAAIYFYFAKIAYQTPSIEVSISNFPQILRYFLNGVFINISRPFTLLNIPSTLIILLGHTIFLLSLFIVWTYKQTIRNFTKIIIFLGGFYVSLFVLISVSRFQFGVEQSYESRYLYYYLIPLVIYFAFIAQNINKSFKYKKTFKVLLSIFLIVFLAGSLIRGYYYKFDREALYLNNYGQLSAFILDSSSQADLSNLHPFSPSQELKDIYLNLIQKPIEEDNSFKEFLRDNHVFINKLDLEPDSNQAVVVDNETSFYQTFYSPYNNLAGIKFFIPAPYHNPSDSQVLTLYDESCQQILREVIIKIPRIRYGYLQGIFPYIEKSKEKTFCFSVKPTAAAKINDLSIQLAKPNTYTQGAFVLDGNITEKDLFFYPLYQFS